MYRRQTRSWMTAVLVLVLAFAGSPGWAAARSSQDELKPSWNDLWERVSTWFGVASLALRPQARQNGQVKTCAMIDPNGTPACTTAVSVEWSCSGWVSPDGRCLN